MTTAVATNLEAKFQVIEYIINKAGIGSWAYADHEGLRAWRAYHDFALRGALTEGEEQQMKNWEATKLATWAKSVLQYDLTRSW
eukprot:11161184-Lingulodinium_polyedra.AAC.1